MYHIPALRHHNIIHVLIGNKPTRRVSHSKYCNTHIVHYLYRIATFYTKVFRFLFIDFALKMSEQQTFDLLNALTDTL